MQEGKVGMQHGVSSGTKASHCMHKQEQQPVVSGSLERHIWEMQ
jgi:hypothetical protein